MAYEFNNLIQLLDHWLPALHEDMPPDEWDRLLNDCQSLLPREAEASGDVLREELVTDLHAICLRYRAVRKILPRGGLLPEPPRPPTNDPQARPIAQRLQDVVRRMKEIEAARQQAGTRAGPRENRT
jgi:hypothetical protein